VDLTTNDFASVSNVSASYGSTVSSVLKLSSLESLMTDILPVTSSQCKEVTQLSFRSHGSNVDMVLHKVTCMKTVLYMLIACEDAEFEKCI
jgi:hypothetical protein